MITRIIYKTNRNLGDYEHESVELESSINPYIDDPYTEFLILKNTALKYLELNYDKDILNECDDEAEEQELVKEG